MKLATTLLVYYFNATLSSLYEPQFDYEYLDYFEYQEYVSNGWLDPNHYIEKNIKHTENTFLDGYELINEKVLIPNVRIGYLPIQELPLVDYEIMYDN